MALHQKERLVFGPMPKGLFASPLFLQQTAHANPLHSA
ncbi:hypothetical protein BTH41_04678 [Bacillus mycoides]|nr:hypothetical protein BTH41_04678 [Bacillus mycoides]